MPTSFQGSLAELTLRSVSRRRFSPKLRNGGPKTQLRPNLECPPSARPSNPIEVSPISGQDLAGDCANQHRIPLVIANAERLKRLEIETSLWQTVVTLEL